MALAMRTKANLCSRGPCELQVSRFGPPKTCRFPHPSFPGLSPLKRAGFQVWTRKTCRFGPPKRAGFEVWTPQNVQVSRFGPPKTCRFPGLDPPNAGFQVWTPKTCKFPGLAPKMCKPARLGGSKPANVHVLGVQTWTCTFFGSKLGNLHVLRGSNLETSTVWGPNRKPARLGRPNLEFCTFWGVQTWKCQRFGGLKAGNLHVLGGSNLETCTFGGVQAWNLETCTFRGSKPGNLHVLGGPNLETCTFGGSKPGNLHVLGGLNLETCMFGGSKPGNLHVLGGPNLETCPAYPELVESSGDGNNFSGPRDHAI